MHGIPMPKPVKTVQEKISIEDSARHNRVHDCCYFPERLKLALIELYKILKKFSSFWVEKKNRISSLFNILMHFDTQDQGF